MGKYAVNQMFPSEATDVTIPAEAVQQLRTMLATGAAAGKEYENLTNRGIHDFAGYQAMGIQIMAVVCVALSRQLGSNRDLSDEEIASLYETVNLASLVLGVTQSRPEDN